MIELNYQIIINSCYASYNILYYFVRDFFFWCKIFINFVKKIEKNLLLCFFFLKKNLSNPLLVLVFFSYTANAPINTRLYSNCETLKKIVEKRTRARKLEL